MATPDEIPTESLEDAAARPRRSMLYMPASNARALEKARDLPADAVIFDLEDAVAPAEKETAREQAAAAAAAGGYGHREVVIRINGLDTEWGHFDLPKVAVSGADALLLPKVESEDQIWHLESLMEQWGAPPEMGIMCMIETPLGVLHAAEIAAASPRLTCFVMGTSDLAADMRALPTPDRLPLLTPLSMAVMAARANGIAVVDGVHLDLDDGPGLEQACRQGRELGFDGKSLIHPKQIDAANAAFSPSPAEVAEARRIIGAFEAAAAEGAGVVVVDGRLIENLHVAAAQRLIVLAEKIGIT